MGENIKNHHIRLVKEPAQADNEKFVPPPCPVGSPLNLFRAPLIPFKAL